MYNKTEALCSEHFMIANEIQKVPAFNDSTHSEGWDWMGLVMNEC